MPMGIYWSPNALGVIYVFALIQGWDSILPRWGIKENIGIINDKCSKIFWKRDKYLWGYLLIMPSA